MKQATNPPRLSIVATAAIVLALSLIQATPAAPDGPALDSLIARGVRIKMEKDGTPIEISIGPKAAVTLEDYRLIGTLHTLKRADVGSDAVKLDDETAAALANLDQLEKFFANGAELTDDGFKAFEGWKSLKSFGLDHWGWYLPQHTSNKGTLGPGLAHLASCQNLEQVRLGGCRVDNRVTEALAQIKSLQSVDLQHTTAVTDEGIAALRGLPKLRVVRLSPQFSPRITDAALAYLGEIKTLEEIEVNQTLLTYDKGFSHLRGLPSLKKMVITQVISTDEDISKLQADHPSATITWTKPDAATTAKTKEQFQRFGERGSKSK